MSGEYFANPNLSGKSSFERKDVRLDFDWGTLLPIGGSIAEPFASFPRNNFSVRWSGAVIARFSEPYLFIADADNGVRVRIRKAGSPSGPWTTLIDRWDKDQPKQSTPQSLAAGATYELQVEYKHLTGQAFCRLSWQSASTPMETVDVVYENGLNLASFTGNCFANKMKLSRWFKIDGAAPTPESYDANGWPRKDGEYILTESEKTINGTWLLEFNGKAQIKLNLCKGKFTVNGKDYGPTLPYGEGYDPKRNQTSCLLTLEQEEGTTFLGFSKTSRSGNDNEPNTGITNLVVMRPTAPGSPTPHTPGEIIYRPLKHLAECFSNLRWLEIANSFHSGKWQNRTPADFPSFHKAAQQPNPISGKPEVRSLGENYEYLILFANETGRDLYLTTPVAADDEFFHKLALLLKYGSDGKEPYIVPTENPKYPPLNPNLRVYVEVGNEIWNWAFPSSGQSRQIADKGIEQQTEESKIYNYNGKGDYRSWHALRTVKASDTFRSVFGDAAMGNRVRMLIEYQYANIQDTAMKSLRFIDNWFNNGDGQHVETPHPVNYYIWGAGGAAYYGVANGEGTQTEIELNDPGFEKPVVPENGTAATGSPWQFQGEAAVYRPLTSAVESYTPKAKPGDQKKDTAVGFKFHTGPKPIYVYSVGRVYNRGNAGAHIAILKASDKSMIYAADTVKASAYLTKVFGYYYSPIAEKPQRLEPETDYYILSADLSTGSQIVNAAAVASPGLQILGAAKATFQDRAQPASWNISDANGGDIVLGPVTFLYSFDPSITLERPQPPEGQQAAILEGKGEFSQTLNFPKAGEFALTFNATSAKDGAVTFDIYVDDQKASPRSASDYLPATAEGHAKIGGWGRNNGFKEEWGSAPFQIKAPGPHTIRFVGTATPGGKKNRYTVFDNIRITSVDAIMTSGFGSGSALGQPVENAWNERQRIDSLFALAFGLARVSYETGWSLGGDFYQKPIQNYAKFKDPRAREINDTAIRRLQSAGCAIPVWGVYSYWPADDYVNGKNYPIVQSIIASNNQLPVESDNGIMLPATLTADNAIQVMGKGPKAAGDWLTWTFICAATGKYAFAPSVTGDGKFLIDADGIPLANGAETTIRLTKGVHGIRFRHGEGDVTFNRIEVKPAQ